METKLLELITKGYSQRKICSELNITRARLNKLLKEYKMKTLNKARPQYNKEDVLNRKFNKLTICEISFVDSHGKNVICKCDCGNTITTRLSQLTSGKAKSCGCLQKEVSANRVKKMFQYQDKNIYLDKAKQHIGEKFAEFKIIGVEKVSLKKINMICECNCGNIFKAIYSELKREKIKSCGCYKSEVSSVMGSTVGMNNYKNKYKWYFFQNGKKIRCKSGFEVLFANWLNQKKINFKYEPTCFKVANGGRYTPDFYLTETNEYIETKGFYPQNSNQKQNSELFKKENILTVLYYDDLYELIKLKYKSYGTYFIKAKRKGISIEEYFANNLY